MHESDTGRPDDRPRRQLLACLLAAGVAAPVAARALQSTSGDCVSGEAGLNNPLLWAVAWKQTAAEYFALCHQAYNLARMQLEKALQHHDPQGKPLAVITDMDDTVMHAASYWGHLINENNDFFDDAVWDRWVPKNLVTPVPGAKDFLSFCEREGVEVFYVTSRNQGEKTYEFALGQLRFLEFPFADPEHLTVYRDTSDKSPARTEIGQTHNVVLLIGDNLNDFKRDYYLKDVDERRAAMEHDRAEFGTRFILLPNPTDGHWVRAIFGASEPEASNANRRTLRQAATRVAWDGQ
jgi:5'-nucleotidase (lipoprotein e(P4) family)